MSEQDLHSAQADHAEEVVNAVLPADHQPTKVVLKETLQSENGFIPLGTLAKPNGNGNLASATKPEVAEPVAGE
jgi:hypothetical protein